MEELTKLNFRFIDLVNKDDDHDGGTGFLQTPKQKSPDNMVDARYFFEGLSNKAYEYQKKQIRNHSEGGQFDF